MPRTFDTAHWQGIHRQLFQDLYELAGEFRTVDMSNAAQLKKCLLDCDIRDEFGAPATPTPHQFRHTYATVLLNLDVPQHIVKKLLDHDSDTMTAHYARLSQQTVRRHWEAARKVGITGEVTVENAGPLADAV